MDARSKAANAVTKGRAVVACSVALSGLFFSRCSDGASREPIRIGVLQSLRGTMAISEMAPRGTTVKPELDARPASARGRLCSGMTRGNQLF